MKSAALQKNMIDPAIQQALAEDLGRGGDITSNSVIAEKTKATVVMTAREAGIISGLDVACRVFELVDQDLKINPLKQDGQKVGLGDQVLKVSGNARSILIAERVALNFVGHMSGIASKTSLMVDKVGNYKAKVCSTRKTLPGLRMFEKYAVKTGGGMNHRLGLDDAVLIKDNHIAMAGGIGIALERARQSIGHTVKVEIEVDTLEQLSEVLEIGLADIVMLDNFSNADLKTAVDQIKGRLIVEASGGVTPETIMDIAATGVDMISVGGLTHSAANLDVGLDFYAVA